MSLLSSTISCGCSPISHRLQCDRCGLLARRVAVAPRSPIGYNRARPHPLHQLVAVAPRSPIGYNATAASKARSMVAVAPRSPIGYNLNARDLFGLTLRLLPDLPSATIEKRRLDPRSRCGCSPISHRLQSSSSTPATPASCGCSPISHRLQCYRGIKGAQHGCGCSPISHRLQFECQRSLWLDVAVAPRSPIGYNRETETGPPITLRLLPDLPSATIRSRAAITIMRCGCSPISHRLQYADTAAY